jgi:hypothetical protein
MAPILVTATGVTPQILDNPSLKDLLTKLRALTIIQEDADISAVESTIKEIVEIVEPWKDRWLFEEQVRVGGRSNAFLVSISREILF